ncbi:ATP-dependent nuclease [Hydrogenophaga sp. XSHU_21]
MRLVSFSVTNFRSITDAHKIPIGESTVLLGRNNEGKSNVLRALSIAMKALTSHAAEEPVSYRDHRDAHTYSWRRDFPISLQSRTSGTESIFRLEFELTAAETEEFKNTVKNNLNGILPIEVKFGKNNRAEINVRKQGPGGPALSAKSAKVARYVAEHIQFIYIPAVRTEDEALSVVQEMLSNELAQLERNEEYTAALQKIADLQQPILEKVSGSIQKSLAQFLPGIKGVSVRVPAYARKVALRSQCQIEIDDGSRTLLEYKGDGVKSLAALGLLKDKEIIDGASIVAIEEPESHLHPGAMHSLREVIETLTATNQVVLTTHCPLFVDRASVGRNILIDRNKAKPARDIASIRELLGVRASDNLVNASHVLVVEGDEDVVALEALLPALSPLLSKALRQYQLVIEQIGGAGNLSYKLSLLSNALCVTHVLLDNDEAGKKAYAKAINEKTLKVADTTFVSCRGMPSSEMEDAFDPSVYESQVLDEFGVDLKDKAFRGNAKWSDRMKACFEKQGKPWNDAMKAQVKAVVADAVSKNPAEALHSLKRASIDALVSSLERKLLTKGAAPGEA